MDTNFYSTVPLDDQKANGKDVLNDAKAALDKAVEAGHAFYIAIIDDKQVASWGTLALSHFENVASALAADFMGGLNAVKKANADEAEAGDEQNDPR